MNRIKPLEAGKNDVGYRFFPSARILMTFLVFFAFFCCAISSSNIGFAFVCMVNATLPSGFQDNQTCAGKRFIVEGNDYFGTFLWDKTVQSHLVAATRWGALTLIFPSGPLLDRYGLRVAYGVILFVILLGTLVQPFVASAGYWYVFAARLICGAFSGVTFVGTYTFGARWIPKNELAFCISAVGVGWPLGLCMSMLTSGLLCASPWGWPSIFYVQSAITALGLVLWVVFYKDDPFQVSWISPAEAHFIKTNRSGRKEKKVTVPWRSLLTSPAALSTVLANFSVGFIMVFLGGFLPSYFKEVLYLDVRSNGLFSALPYVSQTLGRLISGRVADYLLKWFSTTTLVKVFNGMATGVAPLIMLALGFLDCRHAIIAIICQCVVLFLMGFTSSGHHKSVVMIAPRFASTIGAMGGTSLMISGVCVSYIAGAMTAHQTTNEWHNTFFLMSAVLIFSCLVFTVFGDGVEQKWAKERKDEMDIATVDK